MNKTFRFQVAALFVLIFVFAQHDTVFAQYQGIWKDNDTNQSHNFFIQHYDTGSTLVLHTKDAMTVDVYQARMQGALFEAASIDAAETKRISILFSSEETAGVLITDESGPVFETLQLTIHKAFSAIRTMHSGIWRDASGALALYVQDYEAGSSIVVSALNGNTFRAFLGTVAGLQFQALGLANAAEECSMEFLGEEYAITAVTLNNDTASPQLENDAYNVLKVFRPPSLDVDFSASARSGETPLEVAFTANVQGSFDSWLWDFGDGAVSAEKNPTHVFTSPGIYTVSMFAGTNPGQGILTLRKDYIQVSEPETILISGRVSDGSGIQGVQLTISGVGAVITDTLGGYSAVVPVGWSGTVTPQLSGYAFEPSLLQYDPLTEDRTSQDFSAIPVAPPTADFTVSGDQMGPVPLTVQFFDQSTGSPLTWNWNFGDAGNPSAAQSSLRNPSHAYATGGVFTVSLAVTNEWGDDTEFRSDYIIATAAPTLLFPANGASMVPPFSLQWNPVAGAASYTVQMCDNASCTGVGTDQYSANTTALAVADHATGTRFWRVRANYTGAYTGPWSSTRTFTVPEPTPPPVEVGTVNLTSPLNGSTVTNPFVLFWQIVANASDYSLQAASDASFQDPWLDLDAVKTTYVTVDNALEGTHYWRVRANVSGGEPGPWSSPWSFTVPEPSPPPVQAGVVELASPPSGSTLTDSFMLLWEQAENASYYRVQAASDVSFQDPWLDRDTVVTTYLTVENAPEGTHFWRVRANVSGGDPGEWSDVWSLTVVYDDPPEPPQGGQVTLVSPEDNETLCGDQTLVWNAVSGAESYRIQVAGDAAFHSLWVNRDRAYTSLSMLVTGGPFYWRVQANFPNTDPGPWSEVRYFYGPGGSAGRECP